MYKQNTINMSGIKIVKIRVLVRYSIRKIEKRCRMLFSLFIRVVLYTISDEQLSSVRLIR